MADDSRFRPNRKYKYGGNHFFELAAIGFLFSTQYIMGSISTASGSLLSDLYHYSHVNDVGISCEMSSMKISAKFKVENELLPKKGHMIFFLP